MAKVELRSYDLMGSEAEALDGGEVIVGTSGPIEGLGVGVVGVDEGSDVGLSWAVGR